MSDSFPVDRIVEYVYVDTRRLERYLRQFTSLMNFTKFAKLRAVFGLTGPAVEFEQDRFPEESADHSRVLQLLRRLEKTNQVSRLTEEVVSPSDDKPFLVGQTFAQRVSIPPVTSAMGQLGSLSLWVSVSLPKRFILFMVEDYPRRDSSEVFKTSSYTLMELLVRELKKELHHTILGDLFQQPSASSTAAAMLGNDPIPALRQLGCVIGDERDIILLARKRAIFHETFRSDAREPDAGWSVFAYPIALAEGRVSSQTRSCLTSG